jgi:hypothetical protein
MLPEFRSGYPGAGSGPGKDGSRQTPASPLMRGSAASDEGVHGVAHRVHGTLLVAAPHRPRAHGRSSRWRARGGRLQRRRARAGRRRPSGSRLAGRLAPSATHSSTAGGGGKTNWRPIPLPGRPTGRPWRQALCPRNQCGPARRSTSSPRCPPRLNSSARWLLRPGRRWSRPLIGDCPVSHQRPGHCARAALTGPARRWRACRPAPAAGSSGRMRRGRPKGGSPARRGVPGSSSYPVGISCGVPPPIREGWPWPSAGLGQAQIRLEEGVRDDAVAQHVGVLIGPDRRRCAHPGV